MSLPIESFIGKIINKDCLEVMKYIPDNSVDLVVTSPPYNMRLRIRNGKYTSREKAEHFSKKYKYFGDDIPIDDFYLLHKQILSELVRVSKIVCYNFQIVTGSKEAFFKIIGDFNKDIKDIMIWDKGHGEPAMHKQILNSAYELILLLEDDKKNGRLITNAKFQRGTLSNIIRVGRGKRVSKDHHAVFPQDLVEILIENFSSEGDIVMDPMCGLGSTCVAAKKLNRSYIGIDISEEYCKLAKERISLEQSKIT